MQELTWSQKARLAIREFRTITDVLSIRGFYRPSGRFGQELEACLRNLSPEIYGSMNDPRVVELKGLEYVVNRLPKGIESCVKIILTEEDQFEDTPFEMIVPLKRRRATYRISKKEMCFIISRGLSEIYDIITHMTFLNIEAGKIHGRMHDDHGQMTAEWNELAEIIDRTGQLSREELDTAIWNLSIILGRSYHETWKAYSSLEANRQAHNSNSGLFPIIYNLGMRVEQEQQAPDEAQIIHLTPSLKNIIGHHKYGRIWAGNIKDIIQERQLQDRPLHIISANLHSVINLLYGFAALQDGSQPVNNKGDVYDFLTNMIESGADVRSFAQKHGLYEIPDQSGTHIDCQLIDTAPLTGLSMHPDIALAMTNAEDAPILLVMDYAFGTQAFEVMEELLKPWPGMQSRPRANLGSISIMGKAGILSGEKGDIMLATAHVCEGTSDNYLLTNDLRINDFDPDVSVYAGPMATVLGTSLQNKHLLEMFQTDWNTIGLEMEGVHYQKAINAAIIKGYVSADIKTRYAYYASDNPLQTGSTLAAGAMGHEGIKPTYMITKVILEKIFNTKKDKHR